MEVKQNIFYSLILTEEEAADLISAVESVYGVFSTANKIDEIEPILELKDEIILAANKD